MERVHAERHLDLDGGDIDPAIAFAGDAQDLQEMLGNLLDNACKWARTGVAVHATTQSAADSPRLLLQVDDDGPGIAPERRAQVMARGARLDESVPGSGLGLAIVQDLAELYGGQLTLGESPLGGLRATLLLPGVRA